MASPPTAKCRAGRDGRARVGRQVRRRARTATAAGATPTPSLSARERCAMTTRSHLPPARAWPTARRSASSSPAAACPIRRCRLSADRATSRPVWILPRRSADVTTAGHLRVSRAPRDRCARRLVGGALWLPGVWKRWWQSGITRLLVEGGPRLWQRLRRRRASSTRSCCSSAAAQPTAALPDEHCRSRTRSYLERNLGSAIERQGR